MSIPRPPKTPQSSHVKAPSPSGSRPARRKTTLSDPHIPLLAKKISDTNGLLNIRDDLLSTHNTNKFASNKSMYRGGPSAHDSFSVLDNSKASYKPSLTNINSLEVTRAGTLTTIPSLTSFIKTKARRLQTPQSFTHLPSAPVSVVSSTKNREYNANRGDISHFPPSLNELDGIRNTQNGSVLGTDIFTDRSGPDGDAAKRFDSQARSILSLDQESERRSVPAGRNSVEFKVKSGKKRGIKKLQVDDNCETMRIINLRISRDRVKTIKVVRRTSLEKSLERLQTDTDISGRRTVGRLSIKQKNSTEPNVAPFEPEPVKKSDLKLDIAVIEGLSQLNRVQIPKRKASEDAVEAVGNTSLDRDVGDEAPVETVRIRDILEDRMSVERNDQNKYASLTSIAGPSRYRTGSRERKSFGPVLLGKENDSRIVLKTHEGTSDNMVQRLLDGIMPAKKEERFSVADAMRMSSNRPRSFHSKGRESAMSCGSLDDKGIFAKTQPTLEDQQMFKVGENGFLDWNTENKFVEANITGTHKQLRTEGYGAPLTTCQSVKVVSRKKSLKRHPPIAPSRSIQEIKEDASTMIVKYFDALDPVVIQPRFMGLGGTMCVTELWGSKAKQDFYRNMRHNLEASTYQSLESHCGLYKPVKRLGSADQRRRREAEAGFCSSKESPSRRGNKDGEAKTENVFTRGAARHTRSFVVQGGAKHRPVTSSFGARPVSGAML